MEMPLRALCQALTRVLSRRTVSERERFDPLCPRTFGKGKSTWTLRLLAEVAHEQGLSDVVLSVPTLQDAVQRLGARWKRAKHWISKPRPRLRAKKSAATS